MRVFLYVRLLDMESAGQSVYASESYASAELPFQEAEGHFASTEPEDHDFCFVLF